MGKTQTASCDIVAKREPTSQRALESNQNASVHSNSAKAVYISVKSRIQSLDGSDNSCGQLIMLVYGTYEKQQTGH